MLIKIIAGPSGCGKSWVCKQLQEKFAYIPHDKYSVNKYAEAVLKQVEIENKPLLLDCPFRVSVLAKELENAGHTVELYYIVESKETITERLINRDGVKGVTEQRLKRIDYMNRRANEQADFIGTAKEVLERLKDGK